MDGIAGRVSAVAHAATLPGGIDRSCPAAAGPGRVRRSGPKEWADWPCPAAAAPAVPPGIGDGQRSWAPRVAGWPTASVSGNLPFVDAYEETGLPALPDSV